MEPVLTKLGIIAGGGDAPRQVIAACQKAGRPFFVICLKGQADPDLAADVPHAWLRLGAGGTLCQLFASEHIVDIVMIGRVRRPSLLEIRPDWWSFKALTKIGMHSLGDDGLLRAIGKVFEDECGVRVIGASDILTDLLTPAGVLTRTAPDADARADIDRGVEVVRAIGLLDVGQAAIVQQGLVLGVEAIEGTDALIARAGGLKRAGRGGVLVKLSKPQQDHRLDLPTIGPATVRAAKDAGLVGIVVEAGHSQIVDRAETVRLADEAGLFLIGLNLRDDPHV